MFRDVNQDMGTRVWTKAYVNQEIEQVRTELKESLEERQKKRRLSEVEHSAVKQAQHGWMLCPDSEDVSK